MYDLNGFQFALKDVTLIYLLFEDNFQAEITRYGDTSAIWPDR